MQQTEALQYEIQPHDSTIEEVSQFLGITHLNSAQQGRIAQLVERFAAGEDNFSASPFAELDAIQTELSDISHTEPLSITAESEDAARLFGGLLFSKLS